MKKLLCYSAFLALFTTPVWAQTPPAPQPVPPPPAHAAPPPGEMRSITVSGEASDDVAPDQAVFSIAISSKNKDLNKAKQDNDAQLNKLVAVTKDFQIPTEKVATSNISISPQYQYNHNNQTNQNDRNDRQFDGYLVSRNLRITLDNLSQHEKLLSAMVAAKIDEVWNVEFKLADPEKYTAKIRAAAYANAKAHAESLAQAAGAKLGAPIMIVNGSNMPMLPHPFAGRAMAAPVEVSEAPSLPGMVSLRENVTVTFGLE